MLKHAAFVVSTLAMLTVLACGRTAPLPESPTLGQPSSSHPAASPGPAESLASPAERPGEETADLRDADKVSEPEKDPKPVKTVEPEKVPEKPSPSSGPAGEADDAVEALERTILAQWEKIRSLSAKMTTMEEIRRGEERRTKWDGAGTYDCMRKGDEILVRLEVVNSVVLPPGEEVADNSRKMLTIYDGEFVYSLAEAMGMRHARKIDVDRGSGFEIVGPGVFKRLRRASTLKVLPEGMVNDRPAYVIEGIPKSGDQKHLYYFDKELGIMIKMVVEDRNQERIRTLLITDVEVNPEFSDDHFVFTAPQGVRVRDMTEPKQEKPKEQEPEQEGAVQEEPKQEKAGGDATAPSPPSPPP